MFSKLIYSEPFEFGLDVGVVSRMFFLVAERPRRAVGLCYEGSRYMLVGLPSMRYHDLRHGAASIMAAQGVPARTVMEILGHSQISTTLNVYTYITQELQAEAVDKVSLALWPTESRRFSKILHIPPALASTLASNSSKRPEISQN